MTAPLSPEQITHHTLQQGETQITVLSLGCCVQNWMVGGVPVVLGYSDPADYITNPNFMGAIVGRVANRIGGAEFTLNGETWDLPQNDGVNCLHGGPNGLAHQNWTMAPISDTEVRLSLFSPHGDQGFPGNVQFDVTLTLDDNCLTYDMRANVDAPTPINLAQHQYFNLMGTGDVMDHVLHTRAATYLPTCSNSAPDGRIVPVDDTRFDYRTPRRLGDADPTREGCDASLILSDGEGPAAILTAPNEMRLQLWTNRPALQLYTSPWLGKHGRPAVGPEHTAFHAICLEAQDYPDAMTHGFPSIICTPSTPYRQVTKIKIAPGN